MQPLEEKIHQMYHELEYNHDPLLFNARQLGLLNQAKQHLLEAQRQVINIKSLILSTLILNKLINVFLKSLEKILI